MLHFPVTSSALFGHESSLPLSSSSPRSRCSERHLTGEIYLINPWLPTSLITSHGSAFNSKWELLKTERKTLFPGRMLKPAAVPTGWFSSSQSLAGERAGEVWVEAGHEHSLPLGEREGQAGWAGGFNSSQPFMICSNRLLPSSSKKFASGSRECMNLQQNWTHKGLRAPTAPQGSLISHPPAARHLLRYHPADKRRLADFLILWLLLFLSLALPSWSWARYFTLTPQLSPLQEKNRSNHRELLAGTTSLLFTMHFKISRLQQTKWSSKPEFLLSIRCQNTLTRSTFLTLRGSWTLWTHPISLLCC